MKLWMEGRVGGNAFAGRSCILSLATLRGHIDVKMSSRERALRAHTMSILKRLESETSSTRAYSPPRSPRNVSPRNVSLTPLPLPTTPSSPRAGAWDGVHEQLTQRMVEAARAQAAQAIRPRSFKHPADAWGSPSRAQYKHQGSRPRVAQQEVAAFESWMHAFEAHEVPGMQAGCLQDRGSTASLEQTQPPLPSIQPFSVGRWHSLATDAWLARESAAPIEPALAFHPPPRPSRFKLEPPISDRSHANHEVMPQVPQVPQELLDRRVARREAQEHHRTRELCFLLLFQQLHDELFGEIFRQMCSEPGGEIERLLNPSKLHAGWGKRAQSSKV